MKILPKHIQEKKNNGTPIVMLTAYEASQASLLDELDIDMILVGDSLGNVFAGLETTIPVTMDQMVYHIACVARGARRSLIVGDMPFLSSQISIEEGKRNAGRLIKEGGAQAVKLEVGPADVETVRAIVSMGIPVMAHLGFTPQSVYQQGGYRVQGRSTSDADKMLTLAKQMEDVGCFSVLLEMVPSVLAAKISTTLDIPVIGIGAGIGCDGQVLVTHDVVGLLDKKAPKFVKQYATLHADMKRALTLFKDDVIARRFPAKEHGFD
jgi:3-methyl-2-oxobutanoate hydroxymethyltransferase